MKVLVLTEPMLNALARKNSSLTFAANSPSSESPSSRSFLAKPTSALRLRNTPLLYLREKHARQNQRNSLSRCIAEYFTPSLPGTAKKALSGTSNVVYGRFLSE